MEKSRASAPVSSDKICPYARTRRGKNQAEKIVEFGARDAQKSARGARENRVLNAPLCSLGACGAKKSKRIRVYQLRSDKDFVYFT